MNALPIGPEIFYSNLYMKKIKAHIVLLSILMFGLLDNLHAQPFASSIDILTVTHDQFESYSFAGDKLANADIYEGPSTNSPRDLIELEDGRIAVIYGSIASELVIYNGSNTVVYTHDDWGVGESLSHGGLVQVGNFIYVTDRVGSNKGLVRFDINTGESIQAAAALDYGPVDLVKGGDGYLYALKDSDGEIDKLNSETLRIVRSYALESVLDVRGIAADQRGNIFAASWNGEIARFSSSGVKEKSVQIGINHHDIDLSDEGAIIISGTSGTIISTDRLFSTFGSISLAVSNSGFSSFASSRDTTMFSVNDRDFDYIIDSGDNCPNQFNPDQKDLDQNGIGAACENEAIDTDNDSIIDEQDNCPNSANAAQEDSDKNGVGDACDSDLLSMIPAITAAINKPTITPTPQEPFIEQAQWAIRNELCCAGVNLEFRVTIDGTTKSATTSSCGDQAARTSYTNITPGTKSISAKFVSSICGSKSLQIPPRIDGGKRYLYILEFEANSKNQTVRVVETDIPLD